MILSKTKLKAKMLAVFRDIERSGEELIVTDHGEPRLKITRLPRRESVDDVFGEKRGNVVYREDILKPTADEWSEL